ncbi:hypothetical protein FOPE_10925 [Fonsecaea pedrosoi]|nr:hypothetical protein FOPE_10925 [Fonsecaea pedrosoi]
MAEGAAESKPPKTDKSKGTLFSESARTVLPEDIIGRLNTRMDRQLATLVETCFRETVISCVSDERPYLPNLSAPLIRSLWEV